MNARVSNECRIIYIEIEKKKGGGKEWRGAGVADDGVAESKQ